MPEGFASFFRVQWPSLLASSSLLGRRILALSLDGNSLRVLGCRGRVVERWYHFPLPSQLIKGGVVSDIEGLAEALSLVWRSAKLGGGPLYYALSSLGIATRLLRLPRVAKAELGAVVNREARKVLALSAESTHFFWQEASAKGSQLYTMAYVVAVPREPLRALLEAFRLAHLRLAAIDLKPLALSRLIKERDAAIVHGDSNNLELAVIAEGFPVLIRNVYLGDEGVPREAAQARLLEELGRTLDFYNDTNRDNPLPSTAPLYVSGSLADATLADSLARLTGHPAWLPPSPLTSPQAFPVAEYFVNLGLALRGG